MAKLLWIFVLLVFVLNCSFLAKTQEYSGTVIDQADGKPIEGVLVSVGYSEFYTRTDKNGNFAISVRSEKSTQTLSSLIFRHDNYYPKDTNITKSSTDMHVSLSPDNRSIVFDQSKVHEYRFTITPADSAYLATEGWREKYVQADMSYEGKAYGAVGIRHKGATWLPKYFNDPKEPKISYKVKFTKYDKDKRFYSMKKINLHSMLADKTKMHDMLAYELYREMGIHAPRTSYANVYVNDSLVGLFVAVEDIDGRFTKSRWPDHGDGNLYKEVWPQSTDTKYYMDGLKTNNNPKDNPNVQRMVQYYNAIQASNEQTFEQNVSPYMDFDYFLRYMAVDVAINNWDGIRRWYRGQIAQGLAVNNKAVKHHNYYFYEEENAGGKIWLVPWDMKLTFAEIDPDHIPEWNETPAHCGDYKHGNYEDLFLRPPNCDKLTKLMAAVFWDRYVKLGEQFLKDQFSSQRLIDKINTHAKVISESVKRDPVINDASWANEVSILKSYIPNLVTKFSNHIHSIKPEINSYLNPTQMNDFEFKLADSNMYWVEKSFSENSYGYVTHNTANPLYGAADVRFDFTYRQANKPKAWEVWGNFQLEFEQSTDFSNLKEIRMVLRSDKARGMRIVLGDQDVYKKYGVRDEYGWDTNVSDQIQTITLKVSEFAFPVGTVNPDIKAEVLKSVKRLMFVPFPHYDNNGFLKTIPDIGYLQVDDIEFVYSNKHEVNSYLNPTQLNDFEFKIDSKNMYWVEKSFSENSLGYVTHNTANPLYGTSDVRFDFTYRQANKPKEWGVWGNFQLEFEQSTDFSNLKEIRMVLRSDKARGMRIVLGDQDVYKKYGVRDEYGWDTNVSDQTQTITLKVSEFAFPVGTVNPDIKAEVLKSVKRLMFVPFPHYDNNGFLKTIPDIGYLQVDNIEFVY